MAGVLPNWLSKGHGVGRGLRVAEWDPFAKKDPKIKGGGVPNASESLSIKLRAWGDGTQSVVIGARPGADPRTNRGAGRRLGVGVYRLVHLGSVGAYR